MDCLWHKRNRGVAILCLLSYGLGQAVEKQVYSEKISHLVLDEGNESFITHLGGDAEEAADSIPCLNWSNVMFILFLTF